MSNTKANDEQVGGQHYKDVSIQHWDFVWAQNLDYFQGQITKYVCRHRDKNGIEDLLKAKHFLEKYIELIEGDSTPVLDALIVDSRKVQPTGFVGFNYEGTDDRGSLFTCKFCNQEVRVPWGHYPGTAHQCKGDADRRYVNQG